MLIRDKGASDVGWPTAYVEPATTESNHVKINEISLKRVVESDTNRTRPEKTFSTAEMSVPLHRKRELRKGIATLR